MENFENSRNERTVTKSLLFLVSLSLFHCSCVIGFNINTVKDAQDIYQAGSDGGGFGFSVAQFVVNSSKWLIVGAPFSDGDETLDGAVYRCHNNTCVKMFTNRYVPSMVNGSRGMLGATVAVSSQDSIVITCAPRYTYYDKGDPFKDTDDEINMMGACYVYDGSADKYTRRPYTPCKPGTDGIKNEYKKCAAGLSLAAITGKNSFVVGGVGTAEYKGQYIRMEVSKRNAPDYGLAGSGKGDYSGYAVEAGHFTGQDLLDVASGAPRGSDHFGEVSIYQRLLGGGWTKSATIYGQQFGEYFGSVLAVGDLNGDQLDDLAVGAPFHSNEQQRIADVGKVYIYYQTSLQGRQEVFSIDTTELSGRTSSNGRFGFALAVINDTDQDGYNDLAVGAPLEGKSGAVYIFLGSPGGVSTVPAQVIYGRDVSSDLRGFGSALVGDVDMDNNGYPDLLVGAPGDMKAGERGGAILFKTLPVVQVDVSMIPDITLIKLDDLECDLECVNCDVNYVLPDTAVACFNLNTTLSYSGKRVPDILLMELEWNLDLDNFTQSEDIVLFYQQITGGPSVQRKTSLTISKNNSANFQHKIFVTNAIVEYVQPIRMRISYKLVRQIEDVNYPVLDMKVPHFTTAQVLVYRPEADLSLHAQSISPHATLGVGQLVELNITVVNLEHVPCYNAEIIIELPHGLVYSSVEGPKIVACVIPAYRSKLVICSLGFRFPPLTRVEFIFRSTMKDPKPLFHMTSLTYVLNMTSVNDMEQSNDAANIEMDLVARSDIEISGASDPDQLQVLSTKSIHNVTHIFELTNKGPSPIIAMEIWIMWPVMTSDNIPLLLLSGKPVVGDNKGRCHAEEHELKPLALSNLVACNSDKPRFLCQKLHCNTGPMAAGESVVINVTGAVSQHILKWSKVDNSLLLNSTAEVTAEPYPGVVMSGQLQHSTKVHTLILFPGVSRDEKVAWWVYAISISCGIILLVTLILLLWKLGFFKRGTREQLYSAKRESVNLNWQQESDDLDDGAIYPLKTREGDAGSDTCLDNDHMEKNGIDNGQLHISEHD